MIAINTNMKVINIQWEVAIVPTMYMIMTNYHIAINYNWERYYYVKTAKLLKELACLTKTNLMI